MDHKKVLISLILVLFIMTGCSKPASTNKDFCYAPGKGPESVDVKGTNVNVTVDGSQVTGTTELTTTTTIPKDTKVARKDYKEGDLVSFPNLEKTDADGDPITYTFTKPLDSEGKWQTKIGDAGEYTITITASDGKTEISKDVILVIEKVNRAPVLEPIADMIVNEGDTVVINAKASDPDGDPVTITYSGWMTSSTKATGYDDAGNYKVTVTASDGKTQTQKDVAITVKNVNRAPILSDVKDITATEGDFVTIKTSASDPDGGTVTITYPAPFTKDGEWQTKVGDAGEKAYTISASDGEATSTKAVKVTILPKNRPPVLVIKNTNITIKETETAVIDATATDPDGDKIDITYSGWMKGNSKATGYDDQGVHTVTVTASDGTAQVSQNVTVTVIDVNRPPEIVI